MKLFKLISGIIISIIIITLSLEFGIKYLFEDQITSSVIKRLNNNTENEIRLSDVEISILKNFPSTSVIIHDLLILDSVNELSDSLLYSKSTYIKFNLLDVIKRNYLISNILFENGTINIKYDELGQNNFEIFNDSLSNNRKNEINISNIELNNFSITYRDLYRKVNYISDINNLDIFIKNDEQLRYKVIGKIISNNISINKKDPIKINEITINSGFYKLNESIIIDTSSLIIDNINININNGRYEDSEYDINLSIIEQNISNIIKKAPEEIMKVFEDYKIDGIITLSANISKSEINESPKILSEFKVSNGSYHNDYAPFYLEDVSFFGELNNGEDRNLESSILSINNFTSKKNGYPFNGDFKIRNLKNHHLEASIISKWDLQEINNFISDSKFKNLEGTLEGSLVYNGKLSFDSKMKEYFTKSEHIASLEFKNLSFNYNTSYLNFFSKEMLWEIKNNKLKLDDCNINISTSELICSGTVKNLMPFILDTRESISLVGNIYSKKLNFEEILEISNLNDDDNNFTTVLPSWVYANLDIHANTFINEDFKAKNLSAKIQYNNNDLKLECSELKMEALKGSITSSFMYYENKINDLILKSNISLNKVDIQESFISFKNFGQTFIEENNIKGLTTANIYLQSMWDKNYKIYSESINMNAQIKIEDGELIEFEPMYNLSSYVSLEELKEIKFATLENKIRIEKEKIIIPEMDIYSNALDLHIYGDHSFSNEMDYTIKLHLSNLLLKKVNVNNINIENQEQGESEKTTIQLRMTGDVEDPKISFDGINLKTDVVEEVINEAEKITEIIKEELFNAPKSDSNEIINYQENIEIEWKDEK